MYILLCIIYIYICHQMDIQFITQQQSLETLCFHYIQNQTHKSRNLLTNSILLQLGSQEQNSPQQTLYTIFSICKHIIEDNDESSTLANNTTAKNNEVSGNTAQDMRTDKIKVDSVVQKDYYKNMGTLMKEIANKWTSGVKALSQGEICEIVGFACQRVLCVVSGQQFVGLMALLLKKVKISKPITTPIDQLLQNPKLNISSYRQQTRQHFFQSLLLTLSYKKNQKLKLKTDEIQKLIHVLEQEKDPRNISTVFRIYLYILQNSHRQSLLTVKNKLFDALEMYYPIDFQGDTEKYHIRVEEIQALLDQCVCNQLFQGEVRRLLMAKMAAPPIAKYINTFLLTRTHPQTPQSTKFYLNLLQHLPQQQYLLQAYPQQSSSSSSTPSPPSLPTLITQLLNRLYTSSPIPISTYESIIGFLNNLINVLIFEKQQNSKYAHSVVLILKDIFCNGRLEVRELVWVYVVGLVLRKWRKIVGDVVYVLGLLLPVLQRYDDRYVDSQKVGLLILTLSRTFHSQQQPQPKLLCLKLLMQLARHPQFMKMINQTNILISCLSKITAKKQNDQKGIENDANQIRIIKAYVDYVVQLYSTDQRVLQAILQSEIIEVKVYGLLTLASKTPIQLPHLLHLLHLLHPQQPHQPSKHILQNLKQFKPLPTINLINTLTSKLSDINEQQLTELSQILVQKFHKIQQQLSDNQQKFIQLVFKFTYSNLIMMYLMKSIWRAYLGEQCVGERVRNLLVEVMGRGDRGGGEGWLLAKVVAWFNVSVTVFGKPQMIIVNQQISRSESYISETHCILPVDKTHTYTPQQCIKYPTLIHYNWLQTRSPSLLPFLPTPLLLQHIPTLLPHILQHQNTGTLSKILPNLSNQYLIMQIVPFIVKILENISSQTGVDKIVDCNKILWELQKKSKQDEDLLRALLKVKGRVLVAIEERVLQHRKRRARQSGRTVFSVYNSMK